MHIRKAHTVSRIAEVEKRSIYIRRRGIIKDKKCSAKRPKGFKPTSFAWYPSCHYPFSREFERGSQSVSYSMSHCCCCYCHPPSPPFPSLYNVTIVS